MEDPTTIALNLTFFGTLGVAFAMFIGLFAVFVLTLVIAGVGRLLATVTMAIGHGTARAVRAAATAIRPAPTGPAPAARAAAATGTAGNGPPSPAPGVPKGAAPGGPGRTAAPQLSADWAAAVARADARAAAPAKAETAPDRKAG